MRHPDLDYNRLYVYCDFVKPGKHQYLVTYKNELIEPNPKKPEEEKIEYDRFGQKINKNLAFSSEKKIEEPEFIPRVNTVSITSYHQFLGSAHLSEYNLNIKETQNNNFERKFDRKNSVFKDWKGDNIKKLQEGFLYEVKFWKVPKFVKDEEEVKEIIEYMKQHIEFLKSLF